LNNNEDPHDDPKDQKSVHSLPLRLGGVLSELAELELQRPASPKITYYNSGRMRSKGKQMVNERPVREIGGADFTAQLEQREQK
jgi:hypothetical protein